MDQKIENQAPKTAFSGSRLRVFEEIKALGYEKSLMSLISAGFVKLTQLRKYLKQNEGDFEKTKAAIEAREQRRTVEKQERIQEEILGVDSQGNPIESKPKHSKREGKEPREKRERKEKKERKPREPK